MEWPSGLRGKGDCPTCPQRSQVSIEDWHSGMWDQSRHFDAEAGDLPLPHHCRPSHWVHLRGPLRAVKLFTEGRDNQLFSRGPGAKQVFCILSLAVVKSHHGRDAFQNNSFCEGPFLDQLYGYRILVWRHLWQCGKQAISGSALASAHFKVTTLHWCLVKTFANALRYTSG